MPTSGNGQGSNGSLIANVPVTEIRVHGVGGPTPEDLIDDPRPKQITGDSEAGFFVRRWTSSEDAGVPGRVEGYSWRGMNTRSKSKALWILLAPFALSNIAGFMVRTTAARRRRMIEGLVRAAQLSLTLYLVVWLCIAAVDQFAYQCGNNVDCWQGRWFAGLFSSRLMAPPTRSLVVGGGIVVLALAALWLVARAPRRYEKYPTEALGPAGGEDRDAEDREALFGTPLARPDFWGRPETIHDLLCVHLGAAFALLGGVIGYAALQYGRHDYRAFKALVSIGSIAVIGAAFVLLFLWSWRSEREPSANKEWWSWSAGRAVLGLGVAVLVAGAELAWLGRTHIVGADLPGLRWIFGAIVISQAVVLLLLGLACAPLRVGASTVTIIIIAITVNWASHWDVKFAAFLVCFALTAAVTLIGLSPAVNGMVRRRIPRLKHREVDPYALAPFLVSILAYVVFYGLASALTGRLADVLGDPLPTGLQESLASGPTPIRYWFTEEWNGAVWCIGLVLVVLTAALLYSWVLPHRRWNQRPSAEVPADYDGARADNDLVMQARKMVCRTGFILCLYDVVAIAAALAVALVSVAYFTDYVGTHRAAPPARTVSGLVLGALALGVVAVIQGSIKDESRRRSLGLIWDLMAFWPRHFHPFAPAVYSERAVPELKEGIARVTATGPAVVSAHSQGTVLACCALLQAEPDTRRRTVLVTHGSPLMKLYGTFFPLYFSPQAFQQLAAELAPGDAGGRRWTNIYRWTDPVGGALLDEDPAVEELIVDLRHHDPVDLSSDGDPPRIKGHGHYFDDPRVQALIAEIRRFLADGQVVSGSRRH